MHCGVAHRRASGRHHSDQGRQRAVHDAGPHGVQRLPSALLCSRRGGGGGGQDVIQSQYSGATIVGWRDASAVSCLHVRCTLQPRVAHLARALGVEERVRDVHSVVHSDADGKDDVDAGHRVVGETHHTLWRATWQPTGQHYRSPGPPQTHIACSMAT